MKKLTRYILKEHAGPFISSLTILMLVLLLKFISQFVGRIFGKGLSLSTIFEILYLNLAWMLALAGPMAVLVATLMAFGRMSNDNEIVAIRASGISFIKIIRSLLVAGAILTALMYYFNDQILPEYNHRAKLLFQDIGRKKPTLELTEGVFTDFDDFSMLANRIISNEEDIVFDGLITGPEMPPQSIDRLEEITIIDHSKGQYQRTIIASYGYLYFDEATAILKFILYDGELHELENRELAEYKKMKFDKNIFYLNGEEFRLNREEREFRGDREMTIDMLKEKVKEKEKKIQKEKERIKAQWRKFIIPFRTELALLQKHFDNQEGITDSTEIVFSKKQLENSRNKVKNKIKRRLDSVKSSFSTIAHYKKSINKYKVEIYKKLSIAFAIIVFILVGAPLGIKTRKGSMGVSFVFSMGFFVVYWAFLIGGEELADRAILSPFLSMWAPNFVIGGLGIFLSWRTVKDTHPIQWGQILPKLKRVLKKK